jgi:hypothetical protein
MPPQHSIREEIYVIFFEEKIGENFLLGNTIRAEVMLCLGIIVIKKQT